MGPFGKGKQYRHPGLFAIARKVPLRLVAPTKTHDVADRKMLKCSQTENVHRYGIKDCKGTAPWK